MSDAAAAQLRHILHLIPQLADGQEHVLADVASRMGTDVATLRNDLWSLVTRFQEPGGFVEGVQLYLESDRVALVSNHFRRPMRLTAPELCALELGLAMLRTERPPDEHGAIDRARGRLRQVITKLPSELVPEDTYHAAWGTVGNECHLSALRTALRDRRIVRLTYHKGSSALAETRTICPYALVAASGALYVVAYCTLNDGLRIFRLDRIEQVELTPDRFDIPSSFSLDAVLQDGKVFQSEERRTLRIRYSPAIARWIAERERVTPDEDGSVTVEHPLVDVGWAVRHVLQYGPDATVLAPESVQHAIRERLEAMASSAQSFAVVSDLHRINH